MLHRLHPRPRLQLETMILNKGLQSLLEVFEIKLLSLPLRQDAANLLRWNENVGHNVDNPVGRDAVLDRDTSEAVDLNVDQAAVTSNVNTKGAILQKSRQINL